jgi:hypothetical protein
MTKTLAAALMWVLGVASLGAHHSLIAEFDTARTVQVRGVVTKVEWMNPHANVYLTVTDPDGTTTSWQMELQGPPHELERKGWSKTSVKPGDTVVAKGFLPRKQPSAQLLRLSASELTLAGGPTLDASSLMWGVRSVVK